jgi:hypothetical protein
MILNREKETDNVIIFLHIPKTAGCTLHSIINKQYGNKYDIKTPFWWSAPEDTNSLLKYLNEIGIEKIEVLTGHIIFGIHRHIPQKKYTYITFLRNPVERVISAYYYMRDCDKDNLHHIVKNMSLYEFVTDEFFNHQTLNMQTHLISGIKDGNLKIAKDNLKKYFSVVGITERFSESLFIIEKKYGWKIDKYQTQNITKNKPTLNKISNEIIEIIENKNQKDIKLYKFANKLLSKQIEISGFHSKPKDIK